jgi:hypothetical protein
MVEHGEPFSLRTEMRAPNAVRQEVGDRQATRVHGCGVIEIHQQGGTSRSGQPNRSNVVEQHVHRTSDAKYITLHYAW